jgi:periplasmic copper chaperone A
MRISHLAVVGAAASAALLLSAAPAFAHISVQPTTAARGDYSTVAFKVPNEQDDASTVKVEVNLPTDHPIPSVSTEPVPGWTVALNKEKLKTPLKTDDGTVDEAVTKITWTAAKGGGISPGQFQQFPVSLGPLPENTDELVFKALQTYSDKDIARWIQVPQKGQAEPENPAPVLQLTAAGTSASPAPVEKTAATGASSDSGGGTDTTARVLGLVGIVVGVLGVAFGVLAGRRRDNTATATATTD